MTQFITLGELADRYSVQLWRVQKLVDRGKIPAKQRIGRLRVVRNEDIPQAEQALVEAGFIRNVSHEVAR